MTNDLQNFYLFLKQKERDAKTMQSHFKNGSKSAKWFKEWEEHYSRGAFTLLQYCENYRKIKGLSQITLKDSKDGK